jgi:hypothetical protein
MLTRNNGPSQRTSAFLLEHGTLHVLAGLTISGHTLNFQLSALSLFLLHRNLRNKDSRCHDPAGCVCAEDDGKSRSLVVYKYLGSRPQHS